jgi:hypothetical protein
MVLVVCLCLPLLVFGYWLWIGCATEQPDGRHSVWRSAAVITVLRIGALWLSALVRGRSDWNQIPAYFLQMLALPEIYLTKGMRHDVHSWLIVGSLLLAVTSIPWAILLVSIAARLRR